MDWISSQIRQHKHEFFYSIKILSIIAKNTNYNEAQTVPLPQELLSLYLSRTQNRF